MRATPTKPSTTPRTILEFEDNLGPGLEEDSGSVLGAVGLVVTSMREEVDSTLVIVVSVDE